MVTPNEYKHNGKYMGAEVFFGLSTDTKPTACGNGSVFIEIDNVGKKDENGNAVNFICVFDAENSTWYPEAETISSDGN